MFIVINCCGKKPHKSQLHVAYLVCYYFILIIFSYSFNSFKSKNSYLQHKLPYNK